MREIPIHCKLCGKSLYAAYTPTGNKDTKVLQGITNNIEITNHGIYENDQMVAFNWSEIPVISIDIGFMSNATDEANLVTDWYKETMVKGIADGLDYYFQ